MLEDDQAIGKARWKWTMKAAKIIVRHYFVGKFRATAELLLTSNTPIDDIANLYGETVAMSYRRASYVATILDYYLSVSRQPWRRRIKYKLLNDVGPKRTAVLYSYAVHRSLREATKSLRLPPPSHGLREITNYISKMAEQDSDYLEMLNAIKRVSRITRGGYLTNPDVLRIRVGNSWR